MCTRNIIFLLIIFLVGCSTTYHGLQPIMPSKNDKTTNVRPKFQWQTSGTSDAKYDFIMFDCIFRNKVPVPGAVVYHRENLDKPEHTIETDLTPNKVYIWRVRARSGEGGKIVGEWSSYDFFQYFLVASRWGKNWPYILSVEKP